MPRRNISSGTHIDFILALPPGGAVSTSRCRGLLQKDRPQSSYQQGPQWFERSGLKRTRKTKSEQSPQRAHSQIMLCFPGVRRGNEYNPQPLRRVRRQTWAVTAARTTLSAFGVFGHPMWHPEPSLVIPGIAPGGSAPADSGGPYGGWVLDTGKGDLTPHTSVAT